MSANGNDELVDQINKRITLNLLIQGSAQHAFLTSHHLVRDELTLLDPGLVQLYDKFALAAFMQYWSGMSVLVSGRPARFWKRAKTKPRHPFYRHALLSRHGGELAAAAKQRARERCREKGVFWFPIVFSFQLINLLQRIMWKERNHRMALINLAMRTTCEVWGIDPERLDGDITKQVAFGRLRVPLTYSGLMLRASAVGYGGVLREGERMKVVGKAWCWPLLSHELTKGTVELICMHGMCEWDEKTYAKVVKGADRIEYEPWMLQSGAELWRRVLAVTPEGVRMAEVVMHMARLPARALEALMLAVVENPEWARELMAGLGERERESSSGPSGPA